MKKLFYMLALVLLTHSLYAAELSYNETKDWMQKNIGTFSNLSNSNGLNRVTTIEIDNYGNVKVKTNNRELDHGKLTSEFSETNTFNLNDFKDDKSGLIFNKNCEKLQTNNSINCVLSIILKDESEKIKVESKYSDDDQETDMSHYFQINFISEQYLDTFAKAFMHLVKVTPASPF